MNCLAIDPGRQTGWALPGVSGTELFVRAGDQRVPLPQRHGAWFARARCWLDSTIDAHSVEIIALERQLVIPGAGSLVTLGLRAVFLELASSRRLMVDEIEISTWQKWAKGYGWVKHEKQHGGDEVDASAILAWWQAERLPQVRDDDHDRK